APGALPEGMPSAGGSLPGNRCSFAPSSSRPVRLEHHDLCVLRPRSGAVRSWRRVGYAPRSEAGADARDGLRSRSVPPAAARFPGREGPDARGEGDDLVDGNLFQGNQSTELIPGKRGPAPSDQVGPQGPPRGRREVDTTIDGADLGGLHQL